MLTSYSHITTLEAFHAAVNSFQGCALKDTATRAVIADGNPAAKIMLIGEAPGAQEDLTGKPFVGRSGRLLDSMLQSIGLSRAQNVYITNTVFWRPPSNRTPTLAETKSCRPLLDCHIALIQPRLILLVGGTAAKSVLQTDVPISQLRKQWHPLQNPYLEKAIPCLPTFHPAYLLRNPPAKPDAMEDFLMLQQQAQALHLI